MVMPVLPPTCCGAGNDPSCERCGQGAVNFSAHSSALLSGTDKHDLCLRNMHRSANLSFCMTMFALQTQNPLRPSKLSQLDLGRNLGMAWARRQWARVRGGRGGRRPGGAVQRAGLARAAVLRRGLPRHRPRRHLRPHRRHRPQRADLREGGARVI